MAHTAISEADFQTQIVEYAQLAGWQTMHVRRSIKGADGGWVTATSIKGWPDLVLWGHGRVLFRELKTDRGRLTAAQAEVIASLSEAGADAGVWRPSDWDLAVSELHGRDAIGIDLDPTNRDLKRDGVC